MAMSSSNDSVIRIVRKKKKGAEGHHGGAWKVAYADFVTAMMAFFLVMWIVGLSKPVREAVAAYFRDPTGFMKNAHGGKSPMSAGDKINPQTSKPAPLIPKDGGDAQFKAELKAKFEQAQAALLKAMAQSPEFNHLKDSISVQLTDEGLRIELIEKTSSLFFDAGDARLKPRTYRLLQMITAELKPLNSPIVLEGHTDSRPLSRRDGYTNWELSADRANSARRAMEDAGFPSSNVLAVRGYADRKLLNIHDPKDPTNRRVSIMVPYDLQKQ